MLLSVCTLKDKTAVAFLVHFPLFWKSTSCLTYAIRPPNLTFSLSSRYGLYPRMAGSIFFLVSLVSWTRHMSILDSFSRAASPSVFLMSQSAFHWRMRSDFLVKGLTGDETSLPSCVAAVTTLRFAFAMSSQHL